MRYKKALACILCATISLSMTGCNTYDKEASASAIEVDEQGEKIYENKDEKELETIVETVADNTSSDASKEETVYVKTNPYGVVDSVVVSNWLKNTDNTQMLKDSTNLENIKNVKGSETYTKDGKELVWDSEGKDIYYQGTSEEKLPVDLSISYKLNGDSIAADELAGKDGHVEITLDYKNNCEKNVVINDKDEKIYTPFAAVSGMMLDSEKFKNISVSSGTVISDGNRDIVVGMAFPGLVESLNGNEIEDSEVLQKIEDNIEVPSQITIEADVTDFESGMILTMVSSNIIDSLGLDSIDVSNELEDIKEKTDELNDAGNKLVEGTNTLTEGAEKLYNGSNELTDGSNKLHEGVVTYTEGVGKVNDGALALQNGAERLDNGAAELKDGMNTLKNGIGSLDSGINSANAGAGELKNGAEALNQGAKNLSDGSLQVSDGVKSLTEQVGSMGTSLGQAANAATQISNGISAIVSATSEQTDPSQIDTSDISISGVIDGETASSLMLENIPEGALESYGLNEEQTQAVYALISAVSSQVIPSIADNASTQAAKSAAAVAAANGANSAKGQINAAIVGNGLDTGAAALAEGLNASYTTLTSEENIQKLNALTQGADAVAKGAQELSGGTQKLYKGAESLYEGTNKLSEGSSKIVNGSNTINDGITTLKDGTDSLKKGTGELADGTKELNANSQALVDGSNSLKEGCITLGNGLESLYNGSIELNGGMIRFEDEGLSKISKLFNTDTDVLKDRIKAISDAGKEYRSYTGSSEENCSVKFIIESAEIKK